MLTQISAFVALSLYEGLYKRRPIHAYLKEYNRNLQKRADEIQKIQLQKLQSLVHHAYHNVPYYRDTWNQLGFKPEDLRKIGDLEKLPTLGKQDIKDNFNSFKALNQKNPITKTTGGSTGSPFKFQHSLESYDRRQANMWRGYGFSGPTLGTRSLYLWGDHLGEISKLTRIKDNIYNGLFRRKMLNSFYLSEANIGDYIEQINRYKPETIVSYVSPLQILAEYANKHNIALHKPSKILTGAEPLHEFQRECIEQAFDCDVFNTYGCREFMLIAAECSAEKHLHINDDHLVVEITDDTGKNVKNVLGDIVITDLHNYDFPFIRYKNGDQGQISDQSCSCGLPFRVLDKVEGRKLDLIRTESGKIIPGEFFPHMLKDVAGIAKFQVKQKVLQEIEISYIPNELFNQKDLEYILAEVNRVTGGELHVKFTAVDDIPLTKLGKFRVTISELTQ